jgi:hypothetical protein
VKALKAAELLDGEAHRRSLGFARDDKLKGGGPPWQWWRRRDRTSTTATNPVSLIAFLALGWLLFDRTPQLQQNQHSIT